MHAQIYIWQLISSAESLGYALTLIAQYEPALLLISALWLNDNSSD